MPTAAKIFGGGGGGGGAFSVMVNVLKFLTLVAFQKGLGKQGRPRSGLGLRGSLSRVFPVCYSDTYFVNSSPDLRTGQEKC